MTAGILLEVDCRESPATAKKRDGPAAGTERPDFGRSF